MVAKAAFARLRKWDLATSDRVDVFISISRYIAARAERCYGRSSTILPPPVDLEFFVPGQRRDDFFLAASRLTPFKNIASIVAAFGLMADQRLVVIGDGPERERIERIKTPNVTVLGYQPDAVLRDHLQRARALVFAAPEDFGLIMAESHACGTPVVALGEGGSADIVRDGDPGRTGVLFEGQDPMSIAGAVRRFASLPVPTRTDCRASAERFHPDRFTQGLVKAVEAAWRARSGGHRRVGSGNALGHRVGHAVEAEAAMTSDAEQSRV